MTIFEYKAKRDSILQAFDLEIAGTEAHGVAGINMRRVALRRRNQALDSLGKRFDREANAPTQTELAVRFGGGV